MPFIEDEPNSGMPAWGIILIVLAIALIPGSALVCAYMAHRDKISFFKEARVWFGADLAEMQRLQLEEDVKKAMAQEGGKPDTGYDHFDR
jgi:di/tricarboxylate transporter